MKKKVLLFSPVRKPNSIVSLHLQSLKDLEVDDFDFTFSFFDDNIDEGSSLLLNEFVSKYKNSILLNPLVNLEQDSKKRKERWETDLYDRITKIKDSAIKFFLDGDYDYLFLVDADLVLHPLTIKGLMNQDKSFCSCIFWTKFSYTPTYYPNCWNSTHHSIDDLLKFREKGTFKVNFTGACTLLKRDILEKGVCFKKIQNIEYLGEDKHFCIRANVHGFEIFINTIYPAFHIYDENLIDFAKNLINNNYKTDYLRQWLNEDWIQKAENHIKKKEQNLLKRFLKKIIQ